MEKVQKRYKFRHWMAEKQHHQKPVNEQQQSIPPSTTIIWNEDMDQTAGGLSDRRDGRRRSLQQQQEEGSSSSREEKLRVLYMVTSLSEFDTGNRSTIAGNDRFGKTLVPVVSESVQSMVAWSSSSPPPTPLELDVTVYLITHYHVPRRRYRQLKEALPVHVPLYVWSSATPYGYDPTNSRNEFVMTPQVQTSHIQSIELVTRALSRQHRFVIKDLIHDYDMFVAGEDDMLIKKAHVQQYFQTTQRLFQLRSKAPEFLPMLNINNTNTTNNEPRFYGPMTQTMIKRLIPGFIRVEVVPSPNWQPPLSNRERLLGNGTRLNIPKIPIDLSWSRSDYGTTGTRLNSKNNSPQETAKVDPSICCYRRQPYEQPLIDQVRFWETSINVLSVRQLPDQSWVVLQAGNEESIYEDNPHVRIGEYWTGQDHEKEYFQNNPRPKRTDGHQINNQGGWMATRRQILEWHMMGRCMGGFLPPYDPSDFWLNDGIAKGTVEFWSGGIQLFGVLGCNLQRIIPLDPTSFSASLLYHTSNNKQKQRRVARTFASTNIQEFWGQLNTVRKNAQQRKQMEIAQLRAMLANA